MVAVKTTHIGHLNELAEQEFLSEIKITSLLKGHPNVCPFYGKSDVLVVSGSPRLLICPTILGVLVISEGELGMVSKFMVNGSLASFRTRQVPIDLRIDVLIDVAKGLEYLHVSGFFEHPCLTP